MAALNSQDRWYPRETAAVFEAIVLKDGAPTEAEMVAAIQHQFDCVLRRKATAPEVEKYLSLLETSIKLGGNIAGLQQMLTTVLLESEFLYRMEFGGGPVDEHGRQKLTPHESCPRHRLCAGGSWAGCHSPAVGCDHSHARKISSER